MDDKTISRRWRKHDFVVLRRKALYYGRGAKVAST